MFITLTELLIHLTDTTFKPYMLIYHPGANELSSLNLKYSWVAENTPSLAFLPSFRSRIKFRNFIH